MSDFMQRRDKKQRPPRPLPKVLKHDEAAAIKMGKANRELRRRVASKTGKVLDPVAKPMSYADKTMTVVRPRPKAPALCKNCKLRERRNGSAYCEKCSKEHARKTNRHD